VTELASTGGWTVSDSLCRLTVQCGEDDGPTAVDVALPRNAHVGLLLPSIVDLVHGATTTEPVRWRLSRVGGPPLDESMTLNENDVHDGELLLLTTMDPPAPYRVVGDPCHTVAGVATESGESAVRTVAAVVFLCAATIGAAVLVWSGVVTHATGHVITGGVVAAAAAIGAVVLQRALPDPLPCVTLCVVAVVFTAAVGFLAVPAAPSAANLLLAAAAGLTMAILLLRVTRCGTVCLTAITTFNAMAASAAAGGVAWTLPQATTGAALAALSLGGLGVAARLSIALAGLTPVLPTADGPADDERGSAGIDEARALLAHETLTGLVVGLSGSAALGAVFVALGGLHDGGSWLSAAFSAVVALVVFLRVRTHADARRRIPLIAGGMISITAGLAVVVISIPGQANWVSLAATAVGGGALAWGLGVTASPVISRVAELLEYLALAAVVPLACWVGDLYGLVRGVSLT
jgi:type VII secretion integral membrane protein EccD